MAIRWDGIGNWIFSGPVAPHLMRGLAFDCQIIKKLAQPRVKHGATVSGRPLQLDQPLHDHVALQPREVIDEENAFEMVHLVLKAGSQQTL